MSVKETYSDYPKGASNNARKVRKWLKESGNPNNCLTAVGKRRMNQLADREPLSRDVVARMAQFKRHQQYKDVPYTEGCGGVAWDAWGGSAGINWAIRTMEKINKMNKGYNYRTTNNLVIKDVDTQNRIVAGYFASFDNVDSDGDMIKNGAFSKSINDRGPNSNSNRKIMHLAHHDMRRPIGTLEVLKEDNHGLYFESKLGDHTDGEDALKMYQSGIIREHSIGFQYIPDKMSWVDNAEKSDHIEATEEGKDYIAKNGGYHVINEVKLWEGSYVTFGANSNTPSFGVIKSIEDRQNMLKEINSRMELLIKEITDGTYSDSIFPMLTAELHYVKEFYNSLINFEPVIKATPNNEPNKNNAKEFLIHTLLNKK